MIENVYEDVLSFTDGVLKLNNNSRPKFYNTEDEFCEIVYGLLEKKNKEIVEGSIHRAIIDDELVIHLNPSDKQFYAPIIGFFQPYGFFLTHTDLGKDLHESGKEDVLYDEKYYFLDGIGRWVEKEIVNRFGRKGYDFGKIEHELFSDLKSSPCYKAYEICEKLWKEADEHKKELTKLHSSLKDPEPNEVIIASILFASRDPSQGFNVAFRELENMSISDIFVKSGLYIEKINKIIPPEEVEIARRYITELGMATATRRSIGDINILLKQTEEKLLQFTEEYGIVSFTKLSKQSSNLYRLFETSEPYKRIDELADPIGCAEAMGRFLTDAENQLKRYK